MGFMAASEMGYTGVLTVLRLCMIISVPRYYTLICWMKVVICGRCCLFPGNDGKVRQVNAILKSIKDYAELTYKEVVWYAALLTELFVQKEYCPDNFFLQEMKKAMKGIEDFKADRQIKMAESVIRDLRKTLNTEPVYSPQLYVSPERSKLEWKGTLGICDRIEEFEADVAEISDDLLNRAKELAAKDTVESGDVFGKDGSDSGDLRAGFRGTG